ncbi:hypothetical protein Glove_153g54 [Diversispora epigaea]|uniref:Uncharacterized protein n=1 Tax=Diversispora epigaea TaxID=1348612 RepID=A0A397ISL6_9GLOM|nr:hypothetical protein Glove_153g54 [Diversispora epigaea]
MKREDLSYSSNIKAVYEWSIPNVPHNDNESSSLITCHSVKKIPIEQHKEGKDHMTSYLSLQNKKIRINKQNTNIIIFKNLIIYIMIAGLENHHTIASSSFKSAIKAENIWYRGISDDKQQLKESDL